jgi:CheY-like chemotaxis protein
MQILTKPIEILLVEDNEGDVGLIKEVLEEGKIRNRLHIVDDGVEAMLFLHREGKYSVSPCPGMILLDLNLPKKDGREVLREIKEKKNLWSIPVIVLTTSNDENDILRAYELHVNAYTTKPLDFDQFTRTVDCIVNFWLKTAVLPTE